MSAIAVRVLLVGIAPAVAWSVLAGAFVAVATTDPVTQCVYSYEGEQGVAGNASIFPPRIDCYETLDTDAVVDRWTLSWPPEYWLVAIIGVAWPVAVTTVVLWKRRGQFSPISS